VALGILVLAGLAFFLVIFTPIYIHNYQLQGFVDGLARTSASSGKNDTQLAGQVVSEAHRLELPVSADNVHVIRQADGIRIDVRYQVEVSLPGYTVNLHFYPGAGGQ
jgi:hypothetical protein